MPAFNEVEDKYLKNAIYLPFVLLFWPVILPFVEFVKWMKKKKQEQVN